MLASDHYVFVKNDNFFLFCKLGFKSFLSFCCDIQDFGSSLMETNSNNIVYD